MTGRRAVSAPWTTIRKGAWPQVTPNVIDHAAALAAFTWDAARRALDGLLIHDNWWQTETGGIMIANLAGCDIRPGSIGPAVTGGRRTSSTS